MNTPGYWSRYRLCDAYYDDQGRLYLTIPAPFGYQDLPDNIDYILKEGDTLQTIAARVYADLRDAPGLKKKGVGNLWWVIADFQPPPIPDSCYDPTRRLTPGKKLILPSLRTVQELVFDEARRPDFEG